MYICSMQLMKSILYLIKKEITIELRQKYAISGIILYVFATVFHETAFTFKPVKEAFHLSENWRRRNLRYFPFYGRGYVQLTWEYNYKRYSKILGIDLINQPELCIDPDIAFRILIHGMKKGVFTGKGIGRYINRFRKNYKYARYVINGRDKRNTIAGYASSFEFILQKSF